MCLIEPIQAFCCSFQTNERLPLEEAELVFVNAKIFALEVPGFENCVEDSQCLFRPAEYLFCVTAFHVGENPRKLRIRHLVKLSHRPVCDFATI